MAEIMYNLAVVTGNFKDKYGNDKAIWEHIGNIMKLDDNSVFMTLKASFNPAGIKRKENTNNIIVSMFRPKQDQKKSNDNEVDYEFPF